MNILKAKRVEELRCGQRMHSWRRISEIICDEFPDEPQELHGNQLHGMDLCRDAMCFLGGYEDLSNVPDAERDRWDT